MKHTISPDYKTLTVTIDEQEQVNLCQIRDEEPDDFGSSDMERDYLEPLTCNSELQWINPADTGDLTDAPMLGITGGEVAGCLCEVWTHKHKPTGLDARPLGWIHTSQDGATKFFTPILYRWVFMPYAVRSFLADLADTGKAVFTS